MNTVTHPLLLHAVRPIRRSGEPVSLGVPLPPGAAPGASLLSIRRGGESVSFDTTPLERWPDGSARWVLCHFRAQSDTGIAPIYELSSAGVNGEPLAPPIVTVHHNAAHIDTGVVAFDLKDDSGFSLAATDLSDPSPWVSVRLRIADAQGRALTDSVDDIRVESEGLLQSTAVVTGHIDEVNHLSYVIRLQFFRGLATVRVEVTIRNSRRADHIGGFWDLGDPGSVLLREVALIATFRDAVQEVFCSASVDAPLSPCATPFEIYQESSGGPHWNSPAHQNRDGVVPLTMRGYEIRNGQLTTQGERATPVVSASVGGRTFSATIPYFWQEFPKNISVDETHAVIGLLPARFPDLHELQGGEQKTHLAWLAFAPDPVTEIPLDWCRDPLVVTVSPEQFASAEAFPYVAPAAKDPDARYQELVSAVTDGTWSFEAKREVVDEYGWRNFGDVYADHEAVRHTGAGPLVSHYNNQYDAVAGLICQSMRTGDVRWWKLADELARHVVDIDIYHTEDDKPAYSGGMFWHSNHYVSAETATHRCYSRKLPASSGGPSAEHNYTTGLLLHFLMTGRAASRDAVLGLAEWVVRMDDGSLTPLRWLSGAATGQSSATVSPDYHGPGRGAANSINALLDAHRLTQESRWLIKAEELIHRCIHPDDDVDGRNLLDAEVRWSYTVFLQILGKYLDYKALLGMFDESYAYAQASLLQYARWMVEHERPYLEKPEALEHPTETWAAQDMRKSDVFRLAARHFPAADRDRFMERSQFFYDYALSTLGGSPTRALARPVVILLTNGYAHRRLAGLFDVQMPRPSRSAFPLPTVFVPQKAVARTRAFVIGAVGCLVAAALAVSLLVR